MTNPAQAQSEPTGRGATRRAVVAAAGAVGLTAALAACGDDGGSKAGGELAKTADIPQGGGKIFPDQKVVVTQPSPGEFKAFSAVCTHRQCAVTEVSDGTINCPCHHSKFDIGDGSVKGGPAEKPLPEAKVTVEGDTIKLA